MQLHIPHDNGAPRPKIPSYVVGQETAKVILTDQSDIHVHAESKEEAIRVVEALLKYVKPEFVPKNVVISSTTRKGKAIDLTGQRIRAFRADYYPPTTQTLAWSVQL